MQRKEPNVEKQTEKLLGRSKTEEDIEVVNPGENKKSSCSCCGNTNSNSGQYFTPWNVNSSSSDIGQMHQHNELTQNCDCDNMPLSHSDLWNGRGEHLYNNAIR